MDIEQFRKAGYNAIDRICDYFYSLENLQVQSQVKPGYLREALPSAAPEEGEDFAKIADDYEKLILPGITHWQHPNFFAYFTTANTFEAILGELYAASVSNPGFNWACSPAHTELEAVVMDWAAQLLGLDDAFYNRLGVGGGVLLTSASDSALTAIVAARSLYMRRHPEVSLDQLMIYTTSQTHSLGDKAALVLGLKARTLQVTADDAFSLRGATLRRALEEDITAGKHPFVLIATIGTTSSGAVDRIDEIEEISKDYPSLWVHVDAAWAGVALSCPEYREISHLKNLNNFAHSFCTNFHKWGLTNFDASTLWVRDRKHLTEALDITPPFLRTKEADAGTVIDYRNWHLGLGRRFRSLKLWFVLRSFGAQGFRAYIRRCIALNDQFVSLIRGAPEFGLVAPPSFALTVFRLSPERQSVSDKALTEESLNNLNHIFYDRISARRDIFLTQTTLNGVFCIRFAIGASRTTERHVQNAFDILRAEGALAIDAWTNAT